jgi:hypothetical protein
MIAQAGQAGALPAYRLFAHPASGHETKPLPYTGRSKAAVTPSAAMDTWLIRIKLASISQPPRADDDEAPRVSWSPVRDWCGAVRQSRDQFDAEHDHLFR